MRRIGCFLLVLCLLACNEPAPVPTTGSASASAAPKAPAAKIAVGIAIPSFVHALAWMAHDRGDFTKEGLEATVNVTGGSAAALRTLIAKQSDFVLAGGDAVLKARRAGAEVVVVAAFVNRFYHRIVAKKGVTSLKGKKVGLPFLGGPQDMAVKHALGEAGLKYGEDVEVLGLGKELNRLAAIEKGEIDATTSQTPPARLEELGMEVIADPTASKEPFPYMVMAVRKDQLAERRPHFAGALKALCAASTFYRDASNRDAALAIIQKRVAGSDTAGARLARYEATGPRFLAHPPAPSPEAFTTVGRLTSKPLTADELAAIVDGSLLAQVQKAGACTK